MHCLGNHYELHAANIFVDRLASITDRDAVLCDPTRDYCYNVTRGSLTCSEDINSNNALDYIVVTLIIALCVPFIFANGVMLYYRRYRPIRAKGVDVTVASSVGGLIWIAATLVVNSHFRRKEHTLWSLCTTWTFWLQILFGFGLWLCCLIVRLYRLFWVFKLTRKPAKHIWGPLAALLSPILVFCIFASAQEATQWDPAREDCVFKNKKWMVAALIVVPFYFVIFMVLAYLLRNIRDEFNEYSSIRTGGFMAFALFFLGLMSLGTRTYLEVTGRAFFSLAVAAEVFYYFWARNGYTVYMALTHNKVHLERFNTTLQTRGGLNRTRGNLDHLDASAAQFVEPDANRTGDYKVAETVEEAQGELDGGSAEKTEKEQPMSYEELLREYRLLREREASLTEKVHQLERQQSKGAVTPLDTSIDVENPRSKPGS